MSKQLFLLIFFISVLNADSAYEKGKKLYLKNGCFGCHGNNLEGLHEYPYLANRAKGYMAYKLKRFRSKISDNQQHDMMIPFAINLSDEDIENLTTYMYEFVKEDSGERYDDSYKTHGDGGS